MAIWHCDATNGDDGTGDGSAGNPWASLQFMVDNMTGGDVGNIANTSAQVLTASITWNTGFTVNNALPTVFQAWNNGGSITIQRPDESTPRVGAIINGNGNAFIFNTNTPQAVYFKNISFVNAGANVGLINTATDWNYQGCEFSNVGATGSINSIVNATDSLFERSNFIIDSAATGRFFSLSSATGARTSIQDSYFNITQTGTYVIDFGFNTGGRITNNIFDASELTSVGTLINASNHLVSIYGNTFVGRSGQEMTAIRVDRQFSSIYNNIFYNFNNASSLTINPVGSVVLKVLGHNAYFNSNIPSGFSAIGIDLTANDIIGTGDPFVDSANDDYRVTGSTAEGAGLSNPNSALDIGAVQGASGGSGTTNNIFILND